MRRFAFVLAMTASLAMSPASAQQRERAGETPASPANETTATDSTVHKQRRTSLMGMVMGALIAKAEQSAREQARERVGEATQTGMASTPLPPPTRREVAVESTP